MSSGTQTRKSELLLLSLSSNTKIFPNRIGLNNNKGSCTCTDCIQRSLLKMFDRDKEETHIKTTRIIRSKMKIWRQRKWEHVLWNTGYVLWEYWSCCWICMLCFFFVLTIYLGGNKARNTGNNISIMCKWFKMQRTTDLSKITCYKTS